MSLTITENHVFETIELILVELQKQNKLTFDKELQDISKSLVAHKHKTNIVSIFHLNSCTTIESLINNGKIYINHYLYLPILLPSNITLEHTAEVLLDMLIYYERHNRFKCVCIDGKILFENILCISDFEILNEIGRASCRERV